jgi:hypothetical protein
MAVRCVSPSSAEGLGEASLAVLHINVVRPEVVLELTPEASTARQSARTWFICLVAWMDLIPLSAWLGARDELGWKVPASSIHALTGAFGAGVLGAVLVMRWQERIEAERKLDERPEWLHVRPVACAGPGRESGGPQAAPTSPPTPRSAPSYSPGQARFCAGQDLAEHAQALAQDAGRAFDTVEEHSAPIVTLLATMPRPVVAAVEGVVATAFSSMALTCDSGPAHTLPRALGKAHAR